MPELDPYPFDSPPPDRDQSTADPPAQPGPAGPDTASFDPTASGSTPADPDPPDNPGSPRPPDSDSSVLARLRWRTALLVIRLNLTITYLYAAAASAVGADVVLSLLGVGAGWPVALPFMLLTLAIVGIWKRSRHRRVGRRGSPGGSPPGRTRRVLTASTRTGSCCWRVRSTVARPGGPDLPTSRNIDR